MTKSEWHSVLTEREAKRLMSRGNPVQCVFCQELIQIDEGFIRKRRSGKIANNGSTYTRYYHTRCWEATLH